MSNAATLERPAAKPAPVDNTVTAGAPLRDANATVAASRPVTSAWQWVAPMTCDITPSWVGGDGEFAEGVGPTGQRVVRRRFTDENAMYASPLESIVTIMRAAGEAGIAPAVVETSGNDVISAQLPETWRGAKLDELRDTRLLLHALDVRRAVHQLDLGKRMLTCARGVAMRSVVHDVAVMRARCGEAGMTLPRDVDRILAKLEPFIAAAPTIAREPVLCHGDGAASNVLFDTADPAVMPKLSGWTLCGLRDPYEEAGSVLSELHPFCVVDDVQVLRRLGLDPSRAFAAQGFAVLDGVLFAGELSLEGAVRPIAGLLAYDLCAQRQDLALVSAAEDGAGRIEGIRRRVIESLGQLRRGEFAELGGALAPEKPQELDFRDIAGHDMAKRAFQIAAAGGHGLLMMGPPGSGKTMLASRLPSILAPLSRSEALEAAVIHSVAGRDAAPLLAGIRPFHAPHHCATLAGLVGGGSPPRPGAISLAHNGVLFLDELPEFAPSVLQGIRQPMEAGEVVVTRADGSVRFPARFMLVAAANPCPCGFFGDGERTCTCSQRQVHQYQGRVGGPLMDRIDVHIDVARIPPGQVLSTGHGTSSAKLREGVLAAREYASWRRSTTGFDERARQAEVLVESCAMSEADRDFLEKLAASGSMSGRAIMRTLALARTIADMEQVPKVGRDHLCEAVGFRLREGGA